MLNYLDPDKLVKPLGWFAILVSVVTWAMELTGIAPACPYCQAQRTMIGFVGIIMLLPWVNIITYYFTLVFGCFGAYVSALQIFNNFYKKAFDEFWIYLAFCAFLIMMAQLLVSFKRSKP